MRYTIGGGRMKFEGTRGKRPFVTEGRIMYNENTIILFPEKAVANGKDINNFSGQNPYIWYYTLDGDVLKLETNATWGVVGLYARPFRSGATGWINDGDFRRTNQ
jgi:hypothetical protein